MPSIDAVLFDLDGTLIQYRRSPGEVLQSAFKLLEIDPIFSVEEYYALYDEFAEKCDSMAELRSECFAALAAENGYEQQRGRVVAKAFDDERDQSNVALLSAVPRVLDELSRKYRIAIVTNGAKDAQKQKIEAVNLVRWIDATVIAGHRVPPKPHPEPFERAIQTLDVTAATTVHVGDSLETDIAGADAVGLDSVWISERQEHQGCEPTYRVDAIGALLDISCFECSH